MSTACLKVKIFVKATPAFTTRRLAFKCPVLNPGMLPGTALAWRALTTSSSAEANSTARSWLTLSVVASSMCSPTARQPPSRLGSRRTRASRLSAATALLTYASAINEGAPSAVQAADRFHHLINAREAVEQVVKRCYRFLRTQTLAAPASSALAVENDAGEVAGGKGPGSRHEWGGGESDNRGGSRVIRTFGARRLQMLLDKVFIGVSQFAGDPQSTVHPHF